MQGPVVTKLLFPFVTNQAGFDTGIAISNISDDPFGTEKQEGTCTIYYYGRVTGRGLLRTLKQPIYFAQVSRWFGRRPTAGAILLPRSQGFKVTRSVGSKQQGSDSFLMLGELPGHATYSQFAV